MKTDLDVVLQFYDAIVKDRGIPPTQRELLVFVKKQKLKIKRKTLKNLRWYFEYSALFGFSKNKTKHYATSSIKKYGVGFLDLAYHKGNLARFNRAAKGFLCMVEGLSGKMGLAPLANFTRKNWQKGIEQFLTGDFADITTIVTDADVAISSKTFIKQLYEQFGVKLVVLGGHRKSYKAERGIRTVKTWLAMAMKSNQSNNWVDFLPKIVAFYNDQLVPGSRKFKRKDVNASNYMALITELCPGAESQQNIGSVQQFSPEMQANIFKYKIGDKVLVSNARAPDWFDKAGAFKKKSMLGFYSAKVRTISGLVLKSTSQNYLSICYRLKGETGIFYEFQLRPASFRETSQNTAPEPEPEPIKERPKTRAFLKSLAKNV